MNRWSAAVGIAVAALSGYPAAAEHFDILLTLRSADGIVDAGWDTAPPAGGVRPRPVLAARVGEDLTLEWRLRSEFPHGVMRKVVIRAYAAPQARLGQKEPPPPGAPRLFENTFTADFLPHHAARGSLVFRVTEPGAYLVRLQSEITEAEHGHEHFAAVDLKVE